jgi:chromosome segregation ATPase
MKYSLTFNTKEELEAAEQKRDMQLEINSLKKELNETYCELTKTRREFTDQYRELGKLKEEKQEFEYTLRSSNYELEKMRRSRDDFKQSMETWHESFSNCLEGKKQVERWLRIAVGIVIAEGIAIMSLLK